MTSTEVPKRMGKSQVSPDRKRVSTQRMWAVTLLSGVMLWAALSSLAGTNGRLSSATTGQAAGVCAVLAIFGLRSIPLRWIVRGLAVMSGVMLARFGQLGISDGLSGSWRVLAWLGSFGAALALAPSSRSVLGVNSDSGVPARSIASDTRGRVPAAIAVAAISLVAGFALIIGPRASNWFPTGSSAGSLIDRSQSGSDNVLVARESLDMTTRPNLTDKVVMTVRSPVVTFWRAEIFDQWDGSAWTRSYDRTASMLRDGRVTPSLGDVAARRGVDSKQVFRLESGFATVVPSAASPVDVDSSDLLAQRPDGTLVSPYEPLGTGATYTVTSRQMPLNAEVLRQGPSASDQAGSSISPSEPEASRGERGSGTGSSSGSTTTSRILSQFAQTPVVSDRVLHLARGVTSGETNDFDRILALERWMSVNTTYSINAPLSKRGVDVVDDFLFNTKQGWCEQIASSLVVMARSIGIPARLATGYAPGEWDSGGGRFVVRERDAHAWAEVWFPESGWVPFDPTASVPLAGDDAAAAGASARDWREVLGAVLVIFGLVSLAAAPVARFVRRISGRLRTRWVYRRLLRQNWNVSAGARLERIGAKAGRAREVDETYTRYGAVVAELVGDDRLSEVGVVLDRAAFAPTEEQVSEVFLAALNEHK